MINVAILEDNCMYRSLIEMTISSDPNIRCILSAPSITKFKEAFPKRARIDFALLDVELPGESGIDLIPFLNLNSPKTQVIMLTNVEDRGVLLQALGKGAAGYLLKDFPVASLPSFLETAKKGCALISPVMTKHLVEYFNPPKRKAYEADILTVKEQQVLGRLSDDKSYEEIAALLSISKNGVRYHIKNIYSKLNVKNKADALKKWVK